MYNQGILVKIFHSLDREGKGYLNQEEFLESMQVVCSQSSEEKVDLFLRMVDDDGGGSFSYEEIKEICLLTFEEGDEDEEESEPGKPNILKETADFQARAIF